MEKVVKCSNDKCAQFFMHTKEGIKCPFCHTLYREAFYREEKKANPPSTHISNASEDKKFIAKKRKGIF